MILGRHSFQKLISSNHSCGRHGHGSPSRTQSSVTSKQPTFLHQIPHRLNKSQRPPSPIPLLKIQHLQPRLYRIKRHCHNRRYPTCHNNTQPLNRHHCLRIRPAILITIILFISLSTIVISHVRTKSTPKAPQMSL